MTNSLVTKHRAFHALHEGGCFVIPNPFDIGSARYLQSLGFKALASTSAGAAWTFGLPDNAMPVAAVLDHLSQIAGAVDIPLNADFEGGYAHDPEGVAVNVARAVTTGISGLSIEDSTGDQAEPLYTIDMAVARIRAARAAIDQTKSSVLLTGRAENFLVRRADINDVIIRLKAYSAAGADCLYAPGLRTKEQIAAVIAAVHPKPVNVLVSGPGLTVAELSALGTRRISVGGALARAAWGGMMQVAKTIAEQGSFDGFSNAAPFGDINGFFAADSQKRA